MRPVFRCAVLAAVLSTAAFPCDLVAQTRPRAYSLEDVLRLLRRGVRPARVVSMAQASCITFTVDRAAMLRLRAAGATGGVMSGLRSACAGSNETAPPPAPVRSAPQIVPQIVPPAPAPVRTSSTQPSAPSTTAPPMSASSAALNALASHGVTGIGFQSGGYLDGAAQRGRLYDGSHYDYVIFDATEGDSLHIEMSSSDFTPLFLFGRATSCDSACASSRSRFSYTAASRVRRDTASLDVRIPVTGPYAVRVTSAGRQRRTGEYSLRIERR